MRSDRADAETHPGLGEINRVWGLGLGVSGLGVWGGVYKGLRVWCGAWGFENQLKNNHQSGTRVYTACCLGFRTWGFGI